MLTKSSYHNHLEFLKCIIIRKGDDPGCLHAEKKKNLPHKMLKEVHYHVLYVNMNLCFSFVYHLQTSSLFHFLHLIFQSIFSLIHSMPVKSQLIFKNVKFQRHLTQKQSFREKSLEQTIQDCLKRSEANNSLNLQLISLKV